MYTTFLPRTDAALLAWSLNFKTLITATPTAFGLTSTLAGAYAGWHDAFAAALAACDPAVRTRSAVATKNSQRLGLKNDARLLANLVNGTASVTDAQKLSLGLTVRAMPSPIPAPAFPPALEVLSVRNWTATVRLRDTQSTARRGRPPGTAGASVFSHVGTTAPADISNWKFEGSTGGTKVNVVFPTTVAAGATVWLTAFWFSPRKESGPACDPVGTNLPGGGVTTIAA